MALLPFPCSFRVFPIWLLGCLGLLQISSHTHRCRATRCYRSRPLVRHLEEERSLPTSPELSFRDRRRRRIPTPSPWPSASGARFAICVRGRWSSEMVAYLHLRFLSRPRRFPVPDLPLRARERGRPSSVWPSLCSSSTSASAFSRLWDSNSRAPTTSSTRRCWRAATPGPAGGQPPRGTAHRGAWRVRLATATASSCSCSAPRRQLRPLPRLLPSTGAPTAGAMVACLPLRYLLRARGCHVRCVRPQLLILIGEDVVSET